MIDVDEAGEVKYGEKNSSKVLARGRGLHRSSYL